MIPLRWVHGRLQPTRGGRQGIEARVSTGYVCSVLEVCLSMGDMVVALAVDVGIPLLVCRGTTGSNLGSAGRRWCELAWHHLALSHQTQCFLFGMVTLALFAPTLH